VAACGVGEDAEVTWGMIEGTGAARVVVEGTVVVQGARTVFGVPTTKDE
jgi:hypothetical protein